MAIVDGQIRCGSCREFKPVADFPPAAAKAGKGRCRVCRRAMRSASAAHRRRQRAYYQRRKTAFRERKLLAVYGLSAADYAAMLASQGGGCACCGATTNNNGGKPLFVDHDHQTGVVRGILCHRCNVAIGALGDDAQGVRKALLYLTKPDTAGASAALLF